VHLWDTGVRRMSSSLDPVAAGRGTLNPEPYTLNPKPYTLNPKPLTLNPKP